jgi:hypothetical protein
MTVTSATQTQYTTTSNTANNTKKKEETLDPNDHMLKTLDKEGNELLNQVLEGKTDKEKRIIKMMMDLNLSTEIKNGRLTHITNTDNSKSNVISKLEAYVTMQRKLGNPDMAGTVAASEKFLEAYKKNDSTKDVKNQENSVVDKFLDDLYSKGSTVTASAIIKETIQNKVNEYAQVLMESKGDAPKSESEISKMLIDYKKELLEDYKKSLDAISNDNMTLEQQAIIKLLLEENTQEASSLEKLLVNQKEK